MPNASPGTLRGQVAELNRENARLQAKVKEADHELTQLTNEVLRHAPECWGDGNGPHTVISYVRSLEGQGGGAWVGHTEDCECFS